jgi:hypothetical protein
MTIQGFVPTAIAGVVDTGKSIPGTGVGVFEDTIVNGKSYSTKLTFKNLPVTITKGTNGFVGIEIYDFGLGAFFYKGMNIALAATEVDANLSATALAVMAGTVTATDAVLGSVGASEKNVVPPAASSGGTYATIGKVIALNARSAAGVPTTGGAAQVFDGTASAIKFFININAIAANISATSKVVLNGSVEFHYEDLGADLAVGV